MLGYRKLMAIATVAFLASSIFGTSEFALGADFGTLKGQFVLKGAIPERAQLVKKGDQSAKDSAVCAAEDLFSEELVVNAENKGIANVFIYLRKVDKGKIHPDLAATPADKKEIVFDQKGCHFLPHALIVRTDQDVLVKSGDAVAHNTHTYPLRNAPQNFIVQQNDRTGIKIANPTPELLPIQVKCDIHPWMMAHWLIVDHPYAAITDDKGNFTIEKLPAGTHQFRVWHEKIGYINIDKEFHVTTNKNDSLTVNIEKPTLDLKPIEVPVERFNKK